MLEVVLSVLPGSLAVMQLDERAFTWLTTYQRGVVSRPQALAHGMSDDALLHRIRPGGSWRRLLPGVYLTATGTPTREQLQIASLLFAGSGSLLTGLEALRCYGMRVPASRKFDVLVPVERKRASCGYVVIHRTRRFPQSYGCDGAIRLAPVERAVADAARGLSELSDVRAVVAGAVQQRKCTIGKLVAEVAEGPTRGSAQLRKVLAEVIAGIRSPAEGDFRDLIRRFGLPVPLFNADLYIGGQFLARPDAWWPSAGVAAEVDSREWHLSPADWQQTMLRHDRMAATGIKALHFSPNQIRDQPREVARLIAAALQAGGPVRGITWQQAAA
jgi:hypothetical protein